MKSGSGAWLEDVRRRAKAYGPGLAHPTNAARAASDRSDLVDLIDLACKVDPRTRGILRRAAEALGNVWEREAAGGDIVQSDSDS